MPSVMTATGFAVEPATRAIALSKNAGFKRVLLEAVRRGETTKSLADFLTNHGMSVTDRTIRRYVADARDDEDLIRYQDDDANPGTESHEPRLVPLFPIGSFDRQRTRRDHRNEDGRSLIVESSVPSPCGHKGRIRKGSRLVCMVCHQSGLDHRKALQRNPATDPKPDKKPAPPKAKQLTSETRRQKRSREQRSNRSGAA
jgi:hypothetical protein